jgi:uncharacterized RDD family membrane protein YckC
MRFDEVELEAVPMPAELAPPLEPEEATPARASRFRRLLAILTDLSLFAALVLALSPLLPAGSRTLPLIALGGFVLMVSYYYFVGAWMLWGRTIGGAVFDVRVPTMTLADASKRWALLIAIVAILYSATLASLALAFPA